LNVQAITRHDLEAEIVRRCRESEGFRRQFVADPAATAAKYLQVTTANLPKIVVHEETVDSRHIVLPAKQSDAVALSDQQLEKAAGATPALFPAAVSATVSLAVGFGGQAAIDLYIGNPIEIIQHSGW
jgi:hypothetical protein